MLAGMRWQTPVPVVRLWPPLAFGLQPRWMKAVNLLLLPAGWGLLCGLALQASGALYLLGCGVSAIGGIAGGMEHGDRRPAAARGFFTGSLFGGSILLGFHLGGHPRTTLIPSPEGLQLILTALPGALLAATGSAIRARVHKAHARP